MLRRETALRGWRCYWPVNRASQRGSSWGTGAVAPLFLREGRQHVGLRSGQQRASRASSHPGAPQGQRQPTSLVRGGGTSYNQSQASPRPAMQADPANPELGPLSARRWRISGLPTHPCWPRGGQGCARAADSASGGRGAANSASRSGSGAQTTLGCLRLACGSWGCDVQTSPCAW